MNVRIALAAVTICAVATSPAAATVLSASSHAVGTKPSKADYLRVTEVQKELTATLAEVNDAAVATGPLTASAPSVGGAGYVLQKEGEGGKDHGDASPGVPFYDDGLDTDRLAAPVTTGRGQMPGTFSDNRRPAGSRRGGGGGGGGRHGGGAHAAPEPSTWMLLGVGLAMFGGYVTLRRRTAMES